jgi:flagellar biosynthesis protein FlhA
LRQYMKRGDILMAVIVLLILLMMVVPIPPVLLDVLLALNMAFSLGVLLVTMYLTEPLQFSVFPSLLLLTTLLRLSLNVSATKLILLRGYAGSIIDAFGSFVVGGDYIVGLVIFIILVIIQFVVITNGAGRVAEVAARFTLDAMPGKQMSIDADLNAGMISEEEARFRRRKIQQEADFYGAMDGASKFVRGDAIAGIIIILVNVVGGIIVGMVRFGLSGGDAFQRYALLTVGGGLVSQIPSLMISTAMGIVVTRTASESDLGQEFSSQMIRQPRALAITSALLLVLGLMPGLPKLPFLLLSAGTGVLAYRVTKQIQEEEEAALVRDAAPPVPRTEVEDVMSLLRVEPMELNFGYALIPLVDVDQGGDLKDRVAAVRRQIALELGIVVPSVRIRDSIQSRPNEYVVKIKGVEVARGEVLADCYMAMNPGTATEEVEGTHTREPAFGLPAIWIPASRRAEAERLSQYATLSLRTRGRDREEEPDEFRTCYQRDRDRIIHCKAFRRLKHKTQVFLSPEGDHYRTRLTHTLEVAQIARTISRALRLNEDLTEAIAFGHDLGHTPFGHSGEAALNEVVEGGFRHNEQSLRVVEFVERREGKPGHGLRTYQNPFLVHARLDQILHKRIKAL